MVEGSLSHSATLTMDEVMARLSVRDSVDGTLVIGSAAADTLTSASDFDLVVVLSEIPAGLEPCGVTYIDDRLTDLIFVSTEQLCRILDLEHPVDSSDWLGRIIRWFELGTIKNDRTGRLLAVQRKARTGRWVSGPETSALTAWRGVNYNLAHTRRMLLSDDPVYLTAADLRIGLYGASDLLFNYFAIRRSEWSGEKNAIRYLMEYDPDYLDLFLEFLRVGDRDRKIALYIELAALTVAPVGELWPEGVTVLAIEPQATSPERLANFWEELVKG